MKLDEHPTVLAVRGHPASPASTAFRNTGILDAEWLRDRCLEAGADDAGFVSIDNPDIAQQRDDILYAFAPARTLVSYVCRLHPECMRSPARSVAQLEFNRGTHRIDEVGRAIARTLAATGVGALNIPDRPIAGNSCQPRFGLPQISPSATPHSFPRVTSP